MKGKLFIFMCSLVLTLAATGSALAQAKAPYFDKCPAQNARQCQEAGRAAGGSSTFTHDGHVKTCTVTKDKKYTCAYGNKKVEYDKTTYTKMPRKECEEKKSHYSVCTDPRDPKNHYPICKDCTKDQECPKPY